MSGWRVSVLVEFIFLATGFQADGVISSEGSQFRV